MWASLAMLGAQAALKLIAPKQDKTLNAITQIAQIALPIVKAAADYNPVGIDDAEQVNQQRYDLAVEQTKQSVGDTVKDHLLESGVQLAYSLAKNSW